jgi:ABC-type phosphate transport system auxiliary subunit
MKLENLRSLIRESINEYIKEIDDQGTGAMYEAKKAACEEAIRKREDKLRSIDENEELKEMVDGAKLKEIQKEITELKKYHKKLEKLQGKHANKGKKKEVTTDAKTEEAPLDENDVTAEMNLEDSTEGALNESFVRMQKIAGIIK